jgi:hypothetical protein
MGAPEVLHLLGESGLTVATDAGRLIVTPADRLTDEIRQLIRDNKPGILEVLEFTSYRWLIHFAEREPLEVFTHPDASISRMLREYPDCVAAEPLLEPVHSCVICGNSRQPGASRYCRVRPELPPAYGDRHPLRLLPDDGGDGCEQWVGR